MAPNRPVATEYPDTFEGYRLMAERITAAGSAHVFFNKESKRLGVFVNKVRLLWHRRYQRWAREGDPVWVRPWKRKPAAES